MTFRFSCSVAALLFVPFALGCRSDCESACLDRVEEECCEDDCPDGEDCDCPDEDDCEDDCEDALEDAEEMGCEEEFDELSDCVNSVDDVCETFTCTIECLDSASCVDCTGDCGSEADDLYGCYLEYCADNPNADVCE